MVEEASEQAYRRGVDEGRRIAEEAFEASVPQIKAMLAAMLRDEARQMRQAVIEVAPDIVEIAFEIAQMVLGHAPHDDGAALTERIVATLDEIDDDTLTIRVAPGDVAVVQRVVPDHVSVTGDANLVPGEAILDGRWAHADLTRGALLEAVREAFDA
jgi:flagellar biosynthesis/type III secretory pathway protein FliH